MATNNDSLSPDEWAEHVAGRVAVGVRRRRTEMKLSAQKLADLTSALGYPISRGAIARLENGQRKGKLEVTELIVLAQALETSPTALLWHDMPDGEAWYLPTIRDSAGNAYSWWSGRGSVYVSGVNGGGTGQAAMDHLRTTTLNELMSTREALRNADDNPHMSDERLMQLLNRIPELEERAARDGWTVEGYGGESDG